MEESTLQYLASAPAVILILGLVVFNRQRNDSLGEGQDHEISPSSTDFGENI